MSVDLERLRLAAKLRRDEALKAAQAAIHSAEAEFKREMEAIDVVARMAEAPEVGARARVQTFPGLTAAMRNVIRETSADFTVSDLSREIALRYPYAPEIRKDFIPSIIRKLCKRGIVELVAVGDGSAPNTYRKGRFA